MVASMLSKFNPEDSDTDQEVEAPTQLKGAKKPPLDLGMSPLRERSRGAENAAQGQQKAGNPSEEEIQLKGSGGAEGDVQLKVTKKARRVFDERILTNRDGLLRIYEEFPQACNFRGRGHEAQDAKMLINRYKEWGFQLYPNLAFRDLLSRVESLGSKAGTRVYTENLRERERCRYLNQVLGIPLEHIVMPASMQPQLDDEDDKLDMTSPEAGSDRGRKRAYEEEGEDDLAELDDNEEDEEEGGEGGGSEATAPKPVPAAISSSSSAAAGGDGGVSMTFDDEAFDFDEMDRIQAEAIAHMELQQTQQQQQTQEQVAVAVAAAEEEEELVVGEEEEEKEEEADLGAAPAAAAAAEEQEENQVPVIAPASPAAAEAGDTDTATQPQ